MTKNCVICRYVLNLLLALDRGVNTIFGGDPKETISSRSGKLQDRVWWAKGLCWFLNKLDSEHCKGAEDPVVGSDRVVEQMANARTGNKIFIDSTGAAVTTGPIKIAYILFTPATANDEFLLRETADGADCFYVRGATG